MAMFSFTLLHWHGEQRQQSRAIDKLCCFVVLVYAKHMTSKTYTDYNCFSLCAKGILPYYV